MKTTKVVIVEPEKQPYTSEIPADLDAYQQIVGGWIEVVRPFSDNVCIVCNEEGKLIGLPPNRPLSHDGRVYDVISGTFFVVGIDFGREGQEFCSLTDEQVEMYTDYFGIVNKCAGIEEV